MKKKDKQITLRRIIKNNWYALSVLWKACPGKVIWRLMANAISSGLQMANLFFLRYAVNTAQNNGSFTDALVILLILFAVNVLYYTFTQILWARVLPNFEYKTSSRLRAMAIKKTAECELACYEDPDFYTNYTMVMSYSVDHFDQVLNCVSDLVWCVISFVSSASLAVLVDPFMIIFALFPFVTAVITKKRKKFNLKYDEKVNEQQRRKSYSVRTFYQADFAKEMRLTNISAPIITRFKKATEDLKTIYRNYGFKMGLYWFVEEIANAVVSEYSVLFYVAYRTLVSHTMMYGDCIVAVEAIQYLYWAFKSIIGSGVDFYDHAIYIDKLMHFLEYEPTVKPNKDGPAATEGDITIENVSFRYAGSDTDVLKNISLNIKKGEKIALVGNNGAGKSTLTKLLLRLYDPTNGRITLNGADITTLELGSYRDMYSTVLQDYRHFSMSVSENVLLRPRREGDDEIVRDAIERAGITDRVAEMPHGVDSILDREFDDEGTVLSGGQAQKISIAHVFAKNSPIVILDEPTSALDPIAEYEMYKNMMEACEGKTVIFISHRMSSAVMADRVCLLDHGEVAELGTHKELMEKNGKYAELFRVQAQNYVEGGDEE